MNKSKKLLIYSICFLLSIAFIAGVFLTSNNIVVQANFDEEIKYRSAVLLERNSGKVLVEDKAHDRHPIASVTKLMTVLLTLENIENGTMSLTDEVLVSENANSMGGSQIFLDANVKYKLEDLLKWL